MSIKKTNIGINLLAQIHTNNALHYEPMTLLQNKLRGPTQALNRCLINKMNSIGLNSKNIFIRVIIIRSKIVGCGSEPHPHNGMKNHSSF